MMKYLYSIPKKSNGVVHILKGESWGEQPGDLQLGEFAEMKDRAFTVCMRWIKRYEVVDEFPASMNQCKLCFDPQAREEADKYRQDAQVEKIKDVVVAISSTQEWLRNRRKK